MPGGPVLGNGGLFDVRDDIRGQHGEELPPLDDKAPGRFASFRKRTAWSAIPARLEDD